MFIKYYVNRSKDLSQVHPLSPMICTIYIDKLIKEWVKNKTLNAILFACDHLTMANTDVMY